MEHIISFFATWYIVQTYEFSKQNIKSTMPLLKSLNPYNDKCIEKRTKRFVLNPVKTKNSQENFYHRSLLLYYPHRTEEDLINNCFFEKFDPVSITLSYHYTEIENEHRRVMLLRLFKKLQPVNSLNVI